MPATSDAWLEVDEETQLRNNSLACDADTSEEELGLLPAPEQNIGYAKKE